MTQKIKERLEQAAETAWEQVQNERLEYLESDNAGLRERVKELENELKLSEDTIKHQAERCLKLESALAESEKINFDLAAHQCDKWEPEENGHWSCRLHAQNDRYRKALEDVIIRLGEDKRLNALSIAKEALKQEEQ